MSDRDGDNSSQSNDAALLEELSEFCESESLSVDGLRAIFERHGVATKIDDSSINYTFFHEACLNKRLTEGMLQCLIEYFPNAVRAVGVGGQLPIHTLIWEYGDNMKNVTLRMVQLLIDAYPDSLRHEDNKGSMPLHILCANEKLDDEVAVEILMLLLQRCPESVRHVDQGDLPIYLAATRHSLEFCRILIEAYPGSERITNDNGILPFHGACQSYTVATAKYLYELYPESINVADNVGLRPIYYAITGPQCREKPEIWVEMIQFLLDCDPNGALRQYDGKLPFYWVCNYATNENTPTLNAYLKVLQMIYDAHPEAIESNEITSDVGEFCAEVQTFIRSQLSYARQVRRRTVMTIRDQNGQLPLHRALRDNVTLGSIKLLVKGNSSVICNFDNTGMIPLHIACQYHDSAVVVDYLIGLDSITFRATDFDHNTALHFACRGAKYDTITLLLDKYGGVLISKRNAHNQLPIQLLLESNEVGDREDIKYMESIYRLLRVYPETVIGAKGEFNLDGKKRKFGASENGLQYYLQEGNKNL